MDLDCSTIQLIFLDVTNEYDLDEGDCQTKNLDALLNRLKLACVFQNACACLDADVDATNKDVYNVVRKEILRFVKPRDRYLALGSLLLKSQVFHDTYAHLDRSLIVNVPRTEHKKPYIPVATRLGHIEECDVYPFSISHQFPFVASARLLTETSDSTKREHPIQVGVDIVIYENHNPQLYDSVLEFVDAFRSSFSDAEWGDLQFCRENEHNLLRELYLRWATKEAYTKALGVGLGFNFASFDIRLGPLPYGSLWNTIVEAQNETIRFEGCVFTFEKIRPSMETWLFSFHPLSQSHGSYETQGCGCVAVGPLRKSDSINIESDWTTLPQLIQQHMPCSLNDQD
jgi:phosphopantetheinyl transferase